MHLVLRLLVILRSGWSLLFERLLGFLFDFLGFGLRLRLRLCLLSSLGCLCLVGLFDGSLDDVFLGVVLSFHLLLLLLLQSVCFSLDLGLHLFILLLCHLLPLLLSSLPLRFLILLLLCSFFGSFLFLLNAPLLALRQSVQRIFWSSLPFANLLLHSSALLRPQSRVPSQAFTEVHLLYQILLLLHLLLLLRSDHPLLDGGEDVFFLSVLVLLVLREVLLRLLVWHAREACRRHLKHHVWVLVHELLRHHHGVVHVLHHHHVGVLHHHGVVVVLHGRVALDSITLILRVLLLSLHLQLRILHYILLVPVLLLRVFVVTRILVLVHLLLSIVTHF